MNNKELSYDVNYFKNLKLDGNGISSLVDGVVGHYVEMKKAIEREETIRENIKANKEIEICKIKETTKIILTYLEKSYDERKTQFENYFNRIDKALELHDVNALGILVAGVVELSKNTPFKDLVNVAQVQSDLADPNKVWEL